MVFFICNACGESVKKAAVEKHYQFQCRNCSVLSCVDCGKDFPGDDYKEHTKCISEEEKYSGKNYKPKAGANKGELKQELWTNQVQAAINKCKADPKLRNVLERLKDYPNIPRKKVKFENFVKNSLGMRNPTIATAAWDLISEQITPVNKPQNNGQENNNNNQVEKTDEKSQETPECEENGTSNEEKKLSKREKKEERKKQQNKDEKKDKKKRKLEIEETTEEMVPKKKKKRKGDEEGGNQEDEEVEDDKKSKKKKKKKEKQESEVEESPVIEACEGDEAEMAEDEEEEVPTQKFSWEAAIIGCLKKAEGKELPLKKLKKKVLAEFAARGGDAKLKSEADIMAKFNKKVTKNPRLRSLKDKVKLVS